eukprot:CAMPEP_0173388058 /NCGR_PEP_ID=MMETSP1356-20130122/10452_1 /TAXON_ID=77927 ORGANISM="Hemiselmis virescens, Strain PCC157" /NCGR_SAMPLE_ID=MMETSP1356 /ASSEMBLY_ACC=CAM_ASM_000847 /LENGTH=69 /DNA_ID=CAMNT_0014344861 /DNA_START=80 /DNA_END=289 /DNA_ORIENTATION=-
MLASLYQSKPLWDSWFSSGKGGDGGVLAKAEAIQEAKNARNGGRGRTTGLTWGKPSSCWTNQVKLNPKP